MRLTPGPFESYTSHDSPIRGSIMTGEQLTDILAVFSDAECASDLHDANAQAERTRPNARQYEVIARAEGQACDRLGLDFEG